MQRGREACRAAAAVLSRSLRAWRAGRVRGRHGLSGAVRVVSWGSVVEPGDVPTPPVPGVGFGFYPAGPSVVRAVVEPPGAEGEPGVKTALTAK